MSLVVQQVNAIYRFVTMLFTILDIIHHSVFYLNHDVLENGFCLSSGETYSVELNSSIYWTQLSRFHLKTEAGSRLLVKVS
jgi:enoyl-[acyl-carrier-protein] reductase (NADH)